MRHLLSIADLTQEQIEKILDRAESFAEVSLREIKKVPALRGRTVVNLFYEASTRTSSSFELAAKRLSADIINLRSSGSSVEKGESLKDTVQTLTAYGPAAIVVRAPYADAARLVTKWTDAAVVNAGDGKREHPTQALLDLFTLRRRVDSLAGLNVWIVGDILHSRVARSLIQALNLVGAKVTIAGPPTLVPRGVDSALNCQVRYSLEDVGEADVIYTLRIQKERMDSGLIPSMGEYIREFQINAQRLKSDQLLMHPGPVNRGVELSGEVIDGEQSLIADQVESGVVTRMAVLYELLAERDVSTAKQESKQPLKLGASE